MAGTLIYALVDPQSGLIRYVGKTVQTLAQRLKQHKYDSLRRGRNHKDRWIAKLYRLGTPPVIVLIEAESSWQRECFWIAHYRAAGIELLNGNDGGEGFKGERTPEWRAKLSAALKGRKRTPEHQAKLNEARRGFKYTAASREKMRQSHLGQPPSQAHLDRLRAMNTGRPIPPEQREQIRQTLMGHPVSEESRRKMSEGQQRRFARERAEKQTGSLEPKAGK